jgi:hypothetical protein
MLLYLGKGDRKIFRICHFFDVTAQPGSSKSRDTIPVGRIGLMATLEHGATLRRCQNVITNTLLCDLAMKIWDLE